MLESTRLQLAKITGRAVGNFSRRLRLGSGSVIPGHIGLAIDSTLIEKQADKIQEGIIFVTGTNGKSTTTYYISHVLRSLGKSVVTNNGGANMLTGIATACLLINKTVDYAVFEVDEAFVPVLSKKMPPTHVIVLNLSRDQLDRYAEIEMVASKILKGLRLSKPRLIYNYNNPHTALVGTRYKQSDGYSVTAEKLVKSLDMPVCSVCKQGLYFYQQNIVPTLMCSSCGSELATPDFQAKYSSGMLRLFDQVVGCNSLELAETLAATALLCRSLGFHEEQIIQSLERTPPVPAHRMLVRLGAQTSVVDLLLGKNPDSFTRNLYDVVAHKPDQLVIAINNNIADGVDTSWLWDIDFQPLSRLGIPIIVTGQAADDMALRLQVYGIKSTVVEQVNVPLLADQLHTRTMILANYTAYNQLKEIIRSYASTSEKSVENPIAQPEYLYE